MTDNLSSWPKQLWDGIKELAQPKRRTSIIQRLENSDHKREFLVIGLGRFGTSVAMTLNAYDHDVLAVDADMKRVQTVAQTLPHVMQLDATNIDALREVGADTFDTAVVCIGSDFEANILATVGLQKLGAKKVITKATTSPQMEI